MKSNLDDSELYVALREVKFGDNYLEIVPEFRIYLTSKAHSPQFESEIYGMVSVINFVINADGLT